MVKVFGAGTIRPYMDSKYLLTLVLIVFPGYLSAANICYFSLNNEKEFVEAEKMTKQLNKVSSKKISVFEYQTEGGNPEESFKKMLESRQNCDGLVISGHHTGSFGGKRAQGELGIDFLERMSCEPRYQKFFSHIKGVWLQGCRTLGQKIVGDEMNQENRADFHRERVGAVLEADHLEQGFAQLEMEFSDTLDQDNPLSSRYLRVFPRATVFGWTKTAPGERVGSELSLPYHLAHMGRLSDDRKKYFEDPSGQMAEETALHYANTFLLFFDRDRLLPAPCSDLYERMAMDAWFFHGQAKKDADGNPLPLSFMNPDLQAYSTMESRGNPLLGLAKELGCNLEREGLAYDELVGILDTILQDERLIGYNFNDLLGAIKKYEEAGGKEWRQLQGYLQDSAFLKNFIGKKLWDPTVGTLRKIDYYAAARSLGLVSAEEQIKIERAIKDSTFKVLTGAIGEQDYEQIDYIFTLVDSLGKHGMINTDEYVKLVRDSKNKYIVERIADIFGYSRQPVEGLGKVFNSVIDSSRIDSDSLAKIANIIEYYPHGSIDGADKILERIVDSNKVDNYALLGVAYAIGNSSHGPMKGGGRILEKVILSNMMDEHTLKLIAEMLIQNAKTHPIEEEERVWKAMKKWGVEKN